LVTDPPEFQIDGEPDPGHGGELTADPLRLGQGDPVTTFPRVRGVPEPVSVEPGEQPGRVDVNRDHFLRLAELAGFPKAEVVAGSCRPRGERLFFKLTRG
jgi:hypothetical protein